MAHYATSPEAGAQILLASEVPIPHGFVEYIEGAVHSIVGTDAAVRVTILQAARGADLEAPKMDDGESLPCADERWLRVGLNHRPQHYERVC